MQAVQFSFAACPSTPDKYVSKCLQMYALVSGQPEISLYTVGAGLCVC